MEGSPVPGKREGLETAGRCKSKRAAAFPQTDIKGGFG